MTHPRHSQPLPNTSRSLLSLALSLMPSVVACGSSAPPPDSHESSADTTTWGGKGDGIGESSCPAIPDRASTEPPGSDQGGVKCRWMDWNLSPDGFYLISNFGTTADDTTMGRGTSCSALQTHYAAQCCLFDVERWECLDVDATGSQKQRKYTAPRGPKPNQCHPEDIPETGPPWLIEETRTSDYWYSSRRIDFKYSTVVNQVRSYFLDEEDNPRPEEETLDFEHPEYFYVAGAQRFGCDAYLRVTNPKNNRCMVVYADDGGPGSKYEGAKYGGRRILDASPALTTFLGIDGIGAKNGIGWKEGAMIYVEWGLPGDEPGKPCTPCASTAAKRGQELQRSPFDLAHAFTGAADCRYDDLKVAYGVQGGTPISYLPGLPGSDQ